MTSTRTQEQVPPGSIDKLLGSGLKPKDMVGIPWRVAFALQADGWWLRNAIVWHKPNPMPESVTDRCTSSYEFVFLLAKAARYYYDNEAVKEPSATEGDCRFERTDNTQTFGRNGGDSRKRTGNPTGPSRNLRDVWTIATQPYKGAHFATFPEALIEPCIKAGTSEKGCCPECGAPWQRVVEKPDMAERPRRSEGAKYQQDEWIGVTSAGQAYQDWRNANPDMTIGWHPTCDCKDEPDVTLTEWLPYEPTPCTVLDPFLGSGTTAVVAQRVGCDCIGIELNAEYAEMARQRIEGVQPVEVPGDNGDTLVIEQATMFGTVEVEAS